jgi:hypothetical protein
LRNHANTKSTDKAAGRSLVAEIGVANMQVCELIVRSASLFMLALAHQSAGKEITNQTMKHRATSIVRMIFLFPL